MFRATEESTRTSEEVLVTTGKDRSPYLDSYGSFSWNSEDAFVVVSLKNDPREKIGVLEDLCAGSAQEVHVVGVRGAVVGRERIDSVRQVGSPSDIMRLSMKINSTLTETVTDDEGLHLYFDSITRLLRYVNEPTAFQFLNSLTSRVRREGGVGYFEIQPDEHPESTYSKMASLFEETLEQ